MAEPGQDAKKFLRAAGWANASATPIAGDMSARRYFRVDDGIASAVLMVADAPMQSFAQMTNWLLEADLSAPEILYGEPEDGLLLLEDFGSRSIKSVLLDEPERTDEIFSECITLLLKIRAIIPPEIAKPDPSELVKWTRLADTHYPGVVPERLKNFRKVLIDLLENALTVPKSVSLRDFHTENMMWLPDRAGHRRLGLLDYQDAFLTHPAYDLMSLLTDARTWIPQALRENVMAAYLRRSGDEDGAFRTAFAALSAQRNLRILGIFSRAGRHLESLPNTYRYFVEALGHPTFDNVRDEVLSAVPAPEGLA